MQTIKQPAGKDGVLPKTVNVEKRRVNGNLQIAVAGFRDSFELQPVQARELVAAINSEMGFTGYSPAEGVVPVTVNRRRPNGPQAYKGNGKHKWELVTEDPKGAGHTYRLRVPGGFLYRTVSVDQLVDEPVAQSTVFVPLPEVVGYAV